MRRRQDQSTGNRKDAIGHQAELVVCDRGADDEQKHAQGTARNDVQAFVMPVTKAEGDEAERQDDDEHLRVQMAFGELCKERQACHDQRQSQTVYQA